MSAPDASHKPESVAVDKPYYEDPRVALLYGDCRVAMAGLDAESVDAVVTDPPYELGFMGKEWDRSGVAFDAETWAQALRVLKPGGHCLVFGGTRTFHRLALAIEDTGFEIRDTVSWLYGTGFPKARGVLKPAWEPIVVARKPLRGSTAVNLRTYGTGSLNPEACRVPMSETDREAARVPMGSWTQSGTTGATGERSSSVFEPAADGRWPANVILDADAAEMLDQQTGISTSPSGPVRQGGVQRFTPGSPGSLAREGFGVGYGDSGGASRFFYVAKASKSERPDVGGVRHPTVKPMALMRWLVRLATPTGGLVLDPFAGSGTTVEACVREGFRCIAIENHEPYLPLTIERLTRPAQANLDVQAGRSELACETCGRTAYWCNGHPPFSGSISPPTSPKEGP